jgi:hypothetical protein
MSFRRTFLATAGYSVLLNHCKVHVITHVLCNLQTPDITVDFFPSPQEFQHDPLTFGQLRELKDLAAINFTAVTLIGSMNTVAIGRGEW